MALRYLELVGGIGALFASCIAAAAQGVPVPPGAIPGVQPQLRPPPQPQFQPQGQPPNQVCVRLESQLAAIDRGPADPTRAAETRRYDDAINKQQAELDRVVVRLRRTGCERSGFFSLFNSQPAECGPLNKQVQQMHQNIDRMMMEMQRLQGNTADRESERRSVLTALGENNCGPQYRAALANQQRGFFESLFGPGTITPAPPPETAPQSSTYRTVCVRSCDGYYWPISFSTVPSRFPDDERVCQRMCPAAAVSLYTYPNPGGDMSQAVSLNGQPYTALPDAFVYRKHLVSGCSCRHPGESWAHALANINDTVERGDIVVTEDKAKQLSKPREERSRAKTRDKAANEAPNTSASQPNASDKVTRDKSDQKVRNVGPVFLPER